MARFKLILLLSFLFQLVVSAQIEQGSNAIAGGLVLSQTNGVENYRSDVLGVFPSYGHFFTDNFGLIGGMSYTNAKTAIKNFPSQGQIYNGTLNSVTLFLGGRYYFDFLDYRTFGQLDLINQNTGGEVNGNENTQVNITTSKISFGANGWLSENISFEGIAKYTYFKKRSYEDRSRLGQGPIEVLFDIKPYINSGWTEASGNAIEYLASNSMNVGGTAGFRHSLKGNQQLRGGIQVDNPTLNVWFQPKFGYFIFENALIGMEGGISYEDDNLNSPTSIAAAPYLRYYIRVGEGLQVVPNVSYIYNYLIFRQKLLGTTTKTTTFQFAPGIGLHTFLSDGIGLFGNGVLNLKRDPKSQNPDFVKSTILQFQLGLEYYLSAN